MIFLTKYSIITKNNILIALLLLASAIMAQEEFNLCQTNSYSEYKGDLETIKGLDHTNDLFYVKIYVHVLREETEPKMGQSIEDVNRQLQYLYDDFDPLGVHFVWSGYIDYIENHDFFWSPAYYTNPGVTPNIFTTNNHTDGIDIYFFDTEKGGGNILGFGRADGIGGSALIVGGYYRSHKDDDVQIPLSWTKIISHEMGHVLYLWHTHHGTTNCGGENAGDPDACPELVNPITDPNDPLYEEQFLNGSHCGDYIADTPADPLIAWQVDFNTCEYQPTLNPNDCIPDEDANGDAFQPSTSNLMSYTYPDCMEDFTFGQKKRMKNAIWYLPILHNTLLVNYTIIRPLSEENCYVCSDSYYEIYSTTDIEHLSAASSENVETEIISTSGNSFTLRVTSLLGGTEGERGHFNIIASGKGMIVAHQPIWVGKPQTVPDNMVNGSTEVWAGLYTNYRIDDGDFRLDGVEYYDWDFPEPNEPYVYFGGPPPGNPNVWEYYYFSKYIGRAGSSVGNQTGYVTVRGENPCGYGLYGEENDLCVENEDDPEGDLCDEGAPPIIYYPNPSSSLLNIDLSLQDYKIYTVVIYDEMQTVKYSDQTTNIVKTVDVFNLSNDTYYLHVYDDNNEIILSSILIVNH